MFDALLTASAGGSLRPRFSPWVSRCLLKAAKPATTTRHLWGFFPTGKSSCPDRPPRPFFGGGVVGGQNTKPGAPQGAIAAPALARVMPTPRGAAPAPSISRRGGKAPGSEALGNCGKFSSAQPTWLPDPSRCSVGFVIHNRSCCFCRAVSKFVYSDENRIYKSPKAQ